MAALVADLGREGAVAPVKSEGDGEGHLGRVQEMACIPVRESADGEYIFLDLCKILVLPGHPPGIGAEKDPFEGEPGLLEDAPAGGVEGVGDLQGVVHAKIRVGEKGLMQKPDVPVAADVLPQHLHVGVRHQQPWMGPLRRHAPFGHTAGLTHHSTFPLSTGGEKQQN